MNHIREYVEEKDFETLKSWWLSAGYPPIWKALLPETTYILEIGGHPALSACLYLMNSPDACMIENLISNPEVSSEARYPAVIELVSFLEAEAKRRGYTTIVVFSHVDKLKSRYADMGYVPTATNITTFSKSI